MTACSYYHEMLISRERLLAIIASLMTVRSLQRSIFGIFGCQSNKLFLSSYSIDLFAQNKLFSVHEPETAGHKDLHDA